MRRAGAPAREVAAVADLPWAIRSVSRNRDILSIGSRPTSLFLVLEGWAGRYNVRREGSRRFTGFMLPGDLCGIHAVTKVDMDHSVLALTNCLIAELPATQLDRVAQSLPSFAKALWHAKLIEEAILRKWLCNSEDAQRSLAHLLCELHVRMSVIGQVNQGSFALPITQADIGDALSVTPVHTNRMVQKLRRSGWMEIGRGFVKIFDVEGLYRYCAFNPSYLHLGMVKGSS